MSSWPPSSAQFRPLERFHPTEIRWRHFRLKSTLALAVLVALGSSLTVVRAQAASTESPVPRFAPHEISLSASGTYANPYAELTAEATLVEPDGRTTRKLPLFWDGGGTWR